jgi:predicted DCC family thiol-disulfide oxidoreductase YuxK
MPSDTAKLDELRDRCDRSIRILTELADRLTAGDASAELVERLQSDWKNAPGVDPVPPDIRDRLIELQERLKIATERGSSWLTDSAEKMNHLARGRQMNRGFRN